MLELREPPLRPLIAASILSADFGRMAEDCRDVLSAGADLLHLDVMDGHFAPNLTMGVDMIKGVRKHFPDTFLDVHLMVEHPQKYYTEYVRAGANLLSFHIEVCRGFPGTAGEKGHPARHDESWLSMREHIDRIHQAGALAGLVINPPTDMGIVDSMTLSTLQELDLILLMSVHPGRSGQSFMPIALDKAQALKPRLAPHTRLEIDGGINPQTAPLARAAGCDVLVTASALFGSMERARVVEILKNVNRDQL